MARIDEDLWLTQRLTFETVSHRVNAIRGLSEQDPGSLEGLSVFSSQLYPKSILPNYVI